ncbi:MAG: hypothetical protein ACLQVL_05015 [Terriglobia bacterium]
MKRSLLSFLVVTMLAGTPQKGRAQDFATTAMSGLPTQTMRVEYSSPAQLRKLSNYQSLRGKFLGPRLQQLEGALNQIGIREDDINDLMIGWKPGDKEMDLYGYASGNFDKAQVASHAAAQSLTPTPISGQQAYCLSAGVAGTCIVILENSLGAFGPLSTLSALLDVHSGQAPGLSSDPHFTSLIGDVNKSAPIWGIALSTAVADWFGGWLSNQNTLKLDWSQVFQKVDSLTYSIDAADKVNLDMKLNCATAADATTLRQVLDGLKMAQQLAWSAQNPGHENPYSAMNVDLRDKQIGLKMSMAYSELTLASGVGAPQN